LVQASNFSLTTSIALICDAFKDFTYTHREPDGERLKIAQKLMASTDVTSPIQFGDDRSTDVVPKASPGSKTPSGRL